MSKPVISDFEAGVMVALAALKIAATETPGFNVDMLEKAAAALSSKMQGIGNREAFELPINCVLSRHEEVVDLIKKAST